MLIKLELEVTPKQLTGIGQVLSGHMPATETVDNAKPEVPATYFEAISGAADPDIASTDHIEATILVENGGTKVEQSAVDAFDKHWDLKITFGGADDHCSAEYNRAFTEWCSSGCPDLFEQPASPAADAFAADPEVIHTPDASNTGSALSPEELQERIADTVGVDLAKGTNGQMIPWDVRIHGKAKKKNADNSWRLIQGVDRDTMVPQVEAELVAALTAPKPVAGAIEPSQEQTVVTPPKNATAANNVEPAASSVVPAPPTPPAADKPSTFAELLPLVTAAKAAGTLTDETIASTCVELGLSGFGLIATRPDLIPRAAELLGV